MKQPNKSNAVVNKRIEATDSLDFFPTPPWAARALVEHVIKDLAVVKTQSCLEPACGEGHMARALKPYFKELESYDVHDYGYGKRANYLNMHFYDWDWIITNPPFRLAEDFILKAFMEANVGVAMLVRTNFLEGINRHKNLFTPLPPLCVAQFAERVPMHKGRLEPKGSTATAYCWMVWSKKNKNPTQLMWIPPCRKLLEKPEDYL